MKRYLPLLIVSLIFLILPMFITDDYILQCAFDILLFAYLATSWNIVGGFAGQLSFGHASFLTIGGYTSTLLFTNLGLTPWVGMVIGGIVSAIVAVLIGIPTFRLKGAYYAVSTVAFSAAVLTILNSKQELFGLHIGASEGLIIPFKPEPTFWDFQYHEKLPFYYIIFVFLAIVLLVSWLIERSRLGFYLTALREDEDAAKALGINTQRVKLYAAAISAFFTAIGGTVIGQNLGQLLPDYVASGDMSAQMVFLSIVGGIGTVFGPFAGSIFLTSIYQFAHVQFQNFMIGSHKIAGLDFVIYGLVVLLVILFSPKGIIEPLQNLYQRLFDRQNLYQRLFDRQKKSS